MLTTAIPDNGLLRRTQYDRLSQQQLNVLLFYVLIQSLQMY